MSSDEILRLVLVLLGVLGSFRLGIAYEKYKAKCRSREAREWLESMVEMGDMKIEKIKKIEPKEDDEEDE